MLIFCIFILPVLIIELEYWLFRVLMDVIDVYWCLFRCLLSCGKQN